MENDRGNIFVLEAIIISLVLLGAAYAVHTLQGSSLEQVRPRAELERTVTDALTVLSGLEDGNGSKLLDLYLAEAMLCAAATPVGEDDCDGARARNLTLKIESYLPTGAGYMVGLGNSLSVREIYLSPLPRGESVASSYTFTPEWNMTFVASEFSCYPALADANVTLIPIDGVGLSWARYANVTIDETETAGEPAHTPGWWNATLAGATRPAEGIVLANTTANGTLEGATSIGECGHDGKTGALRDALAATPFTTSAARVGVGEATSFAVDLSEILAIGVDVVEANVTVYEPLSPRPGVADSWTPAALVPLEGAGASREGAWSPSADSLFGAHVALLRIGITSGADTFELRRPLTLDVTLPTGEIPYEPTYRAVLQAWLPDWG